MDWDDLRHVLAISRAGGLNGAARALGMNPSSVYRRLEALEQNLQTRLFERLRGGYRLTAAGEALAEAALRMEGEALAVERTLVGTDVRLQGDIRLNTNEGMAYHALPRVLHQFRAAFPDVNVTLTVNNDHVDLSRRDADVVVRSSARPPEHLVGRKVGQVGFASYAAPAYLDRAGRERPLEDHQWLIFDGALARTPMGRWMSQRLPHAAIALRCDTLTGLLQFAAAGLGCTALPCIVGDHHPGLERLIGSHQTTDMQVWILTHPDLRRSARIRACLQFFGTELGRLDFLGERGREAPATRDAKSPPAAGKRASAVSPPAGPSNAARPRSRSSA